MQLLQYTSFSQFLKSEETKKCASVPSFTEGGGFFTQYVTLRKEYYSVNFI